jgi:hypothetical protein
LQDCYQKWNLEGAAQAAEEVAEAAENTEAPKGLPAILRQPQNTNNHSHE